MKHIKVILLFLSLFLLGCNKDDSNLVNNNQQFQSYPHIYPLVVGNEWVYETTQFQSTAKIIDTVRCVGKYYHDGDSIFSFYGGKKDYDITTTFSNLDADKEGLFYRKDSLFMYVNDYHNFAMDKYFIINSDSLLGKNDSTFYKGCGKMGRVFLESKDDIITVPAGVFSCVKFSLYGSGCAPQTFWLAKGVGIVRLKSNYTNYSWDKVELVSYKLK